MKIFSWKVNGNILIRITSVYDSFDPLLKKISKDVKIRKKLIDAELFSEI